MKIRPHLFIALLLIPPLFVVSCGADSAPEKKAERPNVVLIMCDDLGFSDLGSYGGEIRTPRLDELAEGGIRFTHFTNTGRCCPSRAALLTGRDQHAVEMGWMTAVDEHRPGYRGQLTDAVPTIAEIFKQNGYGTYMSGKWHVTVDGNFMRVNQPKPNGSWPTDRGFDEYFGGLSGGGGYYEPKSLMRNETHITEMPEGFYYTTAITQHALEFIGMHDQEKPFFLYLAHYAPHRPMQAPEDRIATYRERYAVGYDVLRQARYDRLLESGIVKSDAPLPMHEIDYEGERPAWESLSPEKKEAWIENMSTYAAMVEIMDDGIGEVVDALKAKGMYDNTLILFLSDNGATHEGGEASKLAASLSNTPYRMFKQYTHFGGIHSPLIIHYPKKFGQEAGTLRRDWSHIKDLLSTCIDIAGLDYPESFNGKEIDPPDGISLVPALKGQALPDRALFYEHQTASAIIEDGWKLVRLSKNHPWELYDLKADLFEQTDLAEKRPEKVEQLKSQWTRWAEANNVFPLEDLPWRKRINHYKALNPDQDGIE
jgi:arylsulfatase A-like enzyme